MKKKTAKKRPHRFVVGYPGERECIYGKWITLVPGEGRWAEPMTRLQAQRYRKHFDEPNKVVVFELVPVGA